MLQYLVNLSIFVPFIIILIVVSVRFSKASLEGIGIYKYTQIIERTNLNKDTDVFVLKIGDEGCVLVSSPSKLEKIKDLDKEEIKIIEEKRKEIKKIKLVNLNKEDNKLKKLDFNKLKIKLKKIDLKESKDGDIS